MTGYVIQLIVIISQYNTFIDHNIVKAGWSIVRDIANMFFIIGLLVIAAGTVLRLENYRYNRLLGRLIIMAFLVNFSRLIAGFLIQTSQVVMLTFVNAYKEIFFGNVASMFGLEEVLRLARTSGDNAAQSAATSLGSTGTTAVTMGALFVTIIASIVMMIVALVITLAICVVLFVRIIALWILIILSPLAYALRILPNTQGIASTYWKEFGRYVVTGPVLAFFLWLSLAILVGTNQVAGDSSFKTIIDSYKKDSGFMNTFVTSIFNIDSIMTFLVSTIFLMMGLKYAQQSGVAGGNFAGKIASTGFGAARGFAATATGYNLLRSRVIRPVQEYQKARRARGEAAIQRRGEAFTQRMDQVQSRTFGTAGRGIRAARKGVMTATGQAIGQAPGAVVGTVQALGEAARAASLSKKVSGEERLGRLQRGLSRADQAVGTAAERMVTETGGAISAGWRQGSEGERIRRAEIVKAKSKREKFEEDIGRYGDMSPAQRKNVLKYGSRNEAYAAGMVAAEKGEIDPSKIPGDKELALKIGRISLDLASSAGALEKSLAGLSRKTREAMFGGMEIAPAQGGKRDMLAEIGFVEEAFTRRGALDERKHTDITAAVDYIKRNEAKTVDQFKKNFLSINTIGNNELEKAIHGLDRVDDEVIIEGTKDPEMRKIYTATMTKIADEIYALGRNYDLESDEGKHQEKILRSQVLGARGGEIEVDDPNKPGAKMKVNALSHAYRNINDNERAKVIAERLVRTEGKNFSKLNYETLKKSSSPIDQSAAKIIGQNINVGALKSIFEKVPKTVEDILIDLRTWVNDKELPPEERRRHAGKIRSASRDDLLSGLVQNISDEDLEKIRKEDEA